MAYVDEQAGLADSAISSVNASTLAAIPSVADLDAQFAYMQMNLARVSIEADTEAAAMQFNASVHKAVADAMTVARDAAIGLATVLGVTALAAAAVGAVSLKMAGDFQSGITTLETGAGELGSNLGMVSQGILQMAVDTGESTKELIAGMYMIESAGFSGSRGLEVLRAAAEGARVGEASLADVANGVTTELVDYAGKNISAAEATNFLIEAVKLGKSHMQDMAQALSSVLPAASAAGVGLADVMAAMATITHGGTDAASAATYLRQMIIALEAPAKAGAKALADIGLTTAQVAAEMHKSLPDALKLIMQHLAETYKVGSPEYMAALKAIAGGSKQMQGILDLTGTHLKTFSDNLKIMAGTVKSGSKDIAGWSDVQKDFNFQMDRAKEVLETGLIRLGLKLLPIITPLVKAFVDWATNGKAVAGTMGEVSAKVQAVLSFLAPVGAFLKSTFTPVWDALRKSLQTLKPQWDQLVAAIKPAMPALKFIAEVIGAVLLFALAAAAKGIAMFAQGVVVAVTLIVEGVMAFITILLKALGFVSTVVTAIVNFFKWLYHMLIGGSIIPEIVLGIINWFTRLRNMWSAIVSYIVSWVVSQFLRLASQLASTMANMVATVQAKLNQIRSVFLNAIAQATALGAAFVNAIWTGMKIVWQQVVSWFTSALNWLKSLWPHSPVREGPLKGSEDWGYNFMKTIADGMRRGFPQVQSAMNALLMPMNRSFNLGISGSSMRFPAMGGASMPPIQITVHPVLNIDGREVTYAIGPHLAQLYITQNAIRQML